MDAPLHTQQVCILIMSKFIARGPVGFVNVSENYHTSLTCFVMKVCQMLKANKVLHQCGQGLRKPLADGSLRTAFSLFVSPFCISGSPSCKVQHTSLTEQVETPSVSMLRGLKNVSCVGPNHRKSSKDVQNNSSQDLITLSR